MMSQFSRIIPMLALFALFTGCAGPQPIGLSPGIQTADLGTLPPPTASDQLAAAREYLIGPSDKLKIDVFGVPEMQKDIQVDASGRLSFPLIGVIDASGKTPGELAAVIAGRLRGQYIRDPQVSVNLVEATSQLITLDGQVTRPGMYPVVGRMTLMRAVATAGGLSEFAKQNEVIVFRQVDGQQYVGLYDLRGIRRGNYADPEIYANDVVIVGDSPARRLFKDIIAGASLITTPLIVLTRK
jgi:polysaccharide export outer membrane protein